MSIEIENVRLKIGKETLVLSIEEAMELRDILAKAFPKEKWGETKIVPLPYPVPYQVAPWPWQRWEPVWYHNNEPIKTPQRWAEITCGNMETTLELTCKT